MIRRFLISASIFFAIFCLSGPEKAFASSTTPPSSGISYPSGGQTLHGQATTVTGTAQDYSGSGLSKVEVSINGSAWTTVAGTASWSFPFVLPADGVYTIRTRATDNLQNVETPGAGIAVVVDNTGTPELQHYNWDSGAQAQGCNLCHSSASKFMPSGYDKLVGFCSTCHNPSGSGHDTLAAGNQHPVMVNVSTNWTKRPTYGSITASVNDNRPYARLKDGRLIICVTCHNTMNKYEDFGRAWEFTTTTDLKTYYLEKGGWSFMGNLKPKVYRSSSLWSGPTYSEDRKSYLVDPSEYTYDETAGTVTFALSQVAPTYIYVTLDYPYLRVSSRDNALCADCHREVTHRGVNCLVCHQSHNTSNISGIKERIRTTDRSERTARFTNITGPGSFADGNTTYDGVCEVCHTATKYYRRDGSVSPIHADGKNYTGKDCTRCHNHLNGFSTSPVAPAPITVSYLIPSNYASGLPVTWTAAATGGSGSLQYRFSRSGPDTGGSFVVVQNWGASRSWPWYTTPGMVGGNTIKVSVQNPDGSGQVSMTAAYTLSQPQGAVYYISPAGYDSGSGSINSPWRTLAYAAGKLRAGDTLYARDGTYTNANGTPQGSSYSINIAGGTSTAPITIKAYPGETPVFDGQGNTKAYSNAGYFLVFGNNAGYIVLDGITITGYTAPMYIYNGAHDITIQNCTLHDNGVDSSLDQGIYVSAPNVSNITIRNNLIKTTSCAGIQAWHGTGVNGLFIYNNVIVNNRVGILLGDGASNIGIYNNTIDKNQYGIDLGQAGQNDTSGVQTLTMKNNIITNSSQRGLRVGLFNVNDVTGDNNLWYGNSTDVQWNGSNWTLAQYKAYTTNEQHGVGGNPSYVSPTAGDYHLSSGSIAIDKGATISMVPYDRDYTSRPKGIACDIGAYEKY